MTTALVPTHVELRVPGTPGPFPAVRLSNGIWVANFSSPHEFTFTDGSVLKAVDAVTAEQLKLDTVEIETVNPYAARRPDVRVVDLKLTWGMTALVRERVDAAQKLQVDVVLIPLPVMNALRDAGIAPGKCRVIRKADRVAGTIHIDRFCF